MRRFAVVGLVMLLGAGAAMAATLNVPFFLDRAPAGAFPPGSLESFFIGLKNTTVGPVTITVSYQDDAGLDVTDGSRSATFTLQAGESISYRPFRWDPGIDTPNATSLNVTRSLNDSGAAIFSWVGASTDIQGRGVQISATSGSFSYLLPPGI